MRTAIAEKRFDREIVPFRDVTTNDGPKESSLEKIAALNPLTEGGRLTAAVASQLSDDSSALLLASPDAMERDGLTPRARIHRIRARGTDRILMLTDPTPATR